ncbi:MAG: S8 family peptidase [Flavitalea sp.]
MGRFFLLLFTGCCMFCQAQLPAYLNKKISPALIARLSQTEKQQTLQVIVSFNNDHSFHNYKSLLTVTSSYAPARILVCTIKRSDLSTLLNDPSITFADLTRKAKEELTTGSLDLSVNKLNLAHHLFPSLNGTGINVSLKEQQFDTTDVDIAHRHFNSGVADPLQSAHASIMSTTLAGAGNSSFFGKGAAPGATLTSSSFAVLLPDDDAVYKNYHISIQNHSYGTTIENFYGADAGAYDASIYNNPTLVHIFSSGNSGTETSAEGNYSGIPKLANITGSFKMAKNIITVGAVDSFGIVADQSSKGPAFDGRIKPELVAFGNDGSSGAAALVSGTAALIQNAYFKSKGHLPTAALVKAILLNSANDHHHHVSYSTGFGNLDALTAINTSLKNYYIEGTVTKYNTASFPIVIPSNCAQLKIILVWTDTPSVANTSKALINDLDAILISPSSQSFQPWVLDPSPNVFSLQSAPLRKTDTLNNVEQITVDVPSAGTYTFHVNGNKLTSAIQDFAIAYSFDTINTFHWIYPTAEDVLQTSTSPIIKWENNIPVNATLEYSINNTAWQTIQPGIVPSQEWFTWTTPDTPCLVKLRMNFLSIPTSIESEEFAVSSPTDLSVGFNCNDSFLLKWNPGANMLFHVYQLNDKYIEPITKTADNFIVLEKSKNPSLHYTVIPEVNGKLGLQANLIDYTTQGIGCYFQSFYATLENNSAALEVTVGTLFHVREIAIEKNNLGTYTSIFKQTSPLLPIISYSDADLEKGVNSYRAAITLNDGSIIYSETEFILYFPGQPVIIYPNPVKQHQPINIIAKEPGIYSYTIHDMNGRFYAGGNLTDILYRKSSMNLAKGIYAVQITSSEGRIFTQKLVVN